MNIGNEKQQKKNTKKNSTNIFISPIILNINFSLFTDKIIFYIYKKLRFSWQMGDRRYHISIIFFQNSDKTFVKTCEGNFKRKLLNCIRQSFNNREKVLLSAVNISQVNQHYNSIIIQARYETEETQWKSHVLCCRLGSLALNLNSFDWNIKSQEIQATRYSTSFLANIVALCNS